MVDVLQKCRDQQIEKVIIILQSQRPLTTRNTTMIIIKMPPNQNAEKLRAESIDSREIGYLHILRSLFF